MRVPIGALLALALTATSVQAQTTREDWIALGTRVHGGFGALIPIGIRVGLDALERLKAKPREVSVMYLDSDKSPCACIADGIAIATTASAGQRSLQVAAEKAPEGALAVAVIRHKQTGEAVRYTIPLAWLAKVVDWNKTLDPAGRYDAVMKAEGLFDVAPVK